MATTGIGIMHTPQLLLLLLLLAAISCLDLDCRLAAATDAPFSGSGENKGLFFPPIPLVPEPPNIGGVPIPPNPVTPAPPPLVPPVFPAPSPPSILPPLVPQPPPPASLLPPVLPLPLLNPPPPPPPPPSILPPVPLIPPTPLIPGVPPAASSSSTPTMNGRSEAP
ncbi:36.4 kDa proline-rich protein [Brachypodium distachyon]|uniref:Uncharacterized protein n=1 Tax=Brachypodium distachyon TaxID=15368 RepID=A0A0Q3H0C6_BRADI|nr:36.4 kDa proline-rich protein [Brachypodium distachyon]KQJ81467.1 hypothetical protein BRADI_5g00912v3 [Brachypodium distachyon]|eukprot:XP_003579965.2 36.4 kDa proline-rich protein [Brachypodium distachyon]